MAKKTFIYASDGSRFLLTQSRLSQWDAEDKKPWRWVRLPDLKAALRTEDGALVPCNMTPEVSINEHRYWARERKTMLAIGCKLFKGENLRQLKAKLGRIKPR